jgi:hypothetical protein
MRTAKEDVAHWDEILDEYEKSIGLPKYNKNALPEQELETYLTMDRSVLEKMTKDTCAEICYRLAQFGFHVQRSLNREQARFNWAENEIKRTIADEIQQYKGYGYVEKALQAIKHNEKAAALDSIRIYAQQRIDRLSYLANGVKHLSDAIRTIEMNRVRNG